MVMIKDKETILRKIKKHLYLKANFYETDVSSRDTKVNLILRDMTYGDIRNFSINYRTEVDIEKLTILENRLSSKDSFAYVLLDSNSGKVFGYCSVSIGKSYESGLEKDINVADNEIYLFDDYVFNEFRGHGYHKEMILLRINKWKDKDRTTAIVCIHDGNIRSEKSYLNCGFKKNKSILYIRPLHMYLQI